MTYAMRHEARRTEIVERIEAMKSKRPVLIHAEVKRETDAAFLLFDGSKEEWFPKSQIREDFESQRTTPERVFEIPFWLAKEKGFI